MFELFIAFGAGLISFLSPCVLPLIPGYISFISGASLNELLTKKKINLLPLILFSLGFSFVFIIFGAAASFLGQILLQNSQTLRIVAGLIIILFSLQLLGIFNISFLNFEKKIYTKKNNNIWFTFVVGMAFGFGWTPCIGPILGSILVTGPCIFIPTPNPTEGTCRGTCVTVGEYQPSVVPDSSPIGENLNSADGILVILGLWRHTRCINSDIDNFVPSLSFCLLT